LLRPLVDAVLFGLIDGLKLPFATELRLETGEGGEDVHVSLAEDRWCRSPARARRTLMIVEEFERWAGHDCSSPALTSSLLVIATPSLLCGRLVSTNTQDQASMIKAPLPVAASTGGSLSSSAKRR
jgi:hypothetical protein